MADPQTPVEKTISSWPEPHSPPPIPAYPRRERPVRKPVPERHSERQYGLRMTFDYSPPTQPTVQPTIPLNIAGVRACDQLNIEREYVQCMVCRNSSFVSCTAELVCSHHVHPRCLQQFMSTKSGSDTYPPCEICKYPAKPKDQLLNQHIRTALLRSKQLNMPATPPRSAQRLGQKRSSSVYSLEEEPSTTKTKESEDNNEKLVFTPFQFRVPINLSISPIVNALSITSRDPCCQFLVSVKCPDYTYSQPSYIPNMLDDQISSRMAAATATSLDITPQKLGRLRLDRRFEYSSTGIDWMTVRALIFEHYIVLIATESKEPVVYSEISTNLLAATLVSSTEASVAIKLKLSSSPFPVYLTCPNRDHLFSFVAALSDKNLNFPLVRTNPSFALQSPFVGDFINCMPSQTVICIPESTRLCVLAEAVGRLRSFDKIAVVHYGNKITTYPLNRQSWHGWQELMQQGPKTPAFTNKPISEILATAGSLFVDVEDEMSSKSIIFVSEDTEANQAKQIDSSVPVYTIGLGQDHSAPLLTRISAASGGHYVYSNRDNVGKYITNMVCEGQTLTHNNVTITLKSRQGTLAGISGYGSAPGENSGIVDETNTGNFVINLGRLHAGHTQTFVASVDVDEKMLKYTCEGSELDILEVVAEANMANSACKVHERKSGRIKIDLNNLPVSYFRGLHTDSPINSNHRLETLRDVIALATATSLERLVKLIQGREHTLAVSIVRKMIQSLEQMARHLSENFQCTTKTETDLVVGCTILIDVLVSDLGFLQDNLTQKSTLATILHMNWILRSSRSFLHNSSLEAIYFDTNKRNVI